MAAIADFATFCFPTLSYVSYEIVIKIQEKLAWCTWCNIMWWSLSV